MGLGMSTPKVSAPKLKRGKKAAAEPARGRSSSPKRSSSGRSSSPTRSPSGKRKSRYEEEEFEGEEEFANWANIMSPAAYNAVAARIAPKASKYEEEYETEEEFEGEEELSALHQQYTPADFSNVATPVNMSIVLLILLFIYGTLTNQQDLKRKIVQHSILISILIW